MEFEQLNELILQSIEHERGAVRVYESAVRCALSHDLRERWQELLDETRRHVATLGRVCEVLQLDPEEPSPSREVVRNVGAALVSTMEEALAAGDPIEAQLVACECVSLAETKDEADWELVGRSSEKLPGTAGKALRNLLAWVGTRQDEHLYRSKGWCRELWMEALGMRAVLPAPEEHWHLTSAIGAPRLGHAPTRLPSVPVRSSTNLFPRRSIRSRGDLGARGQDASARKA